MNSYAAPPARSFLHLLTQASRRSTLSTMGGKSLLLPMGAAILALLGGAARSGMLIPDAAASVIKRREEEDRTHPPLLLNPSDDDVGDGLIGHRSHRSHSSHRSHYSGSSGGYVPDYAAPTPAPAPPPPPPKPAVVSLVVFPGGRVFVDGKLAGVDATPLMALKPGAHTIRIENRFLGSGEVNVVLDEGQTGVVNVDW